MATKKPAGTAVAVKKTTAGNIVDIRALLAKEVTDMASRVGAPGGDSIKVTQDKKFEFPDGTKSAGPIKLVIVDFVSANSFYEGAYDPNNISPPACFSIGSNPTQMVPSENSPVKQASACGACPMNQFGSAGNGKACKNSRVLAVLPPGATADTPLWILKVSPTALKAFDAYVTSVVRSFQLPPVSVVTEVSFDESLTYASLRFGNPEPNEDLEVCFARKEEAMTRLKTEPDVSQFESAPPKKATAPARRR
ncbi:hypothetical protein [Herminiimonas sp. CN]|uniref:hypothetical protein n=1 Tax=Herminiimonas sp. CN TaxID=1349818 RepID=UPI00047430A8|nr:hypothetical protein [Herminiimonas sp. CN]